MMGDESSKDAGTASGQEIDNRSSSIENSIGVFNRA